MRFVARSCHDAVHHIFRDELSIEPICGLVLIQVDERIPLKPTEDGKFLCCEYCLAALLQDGKDNLD